MAATTAPKGGKVSLTLNPHNQNLDTVHRIVASILGRAGCPQCGRIALLDVQFLGDPGPDLSKEGIISMHAEGF